MDIPVGTILPFGGVFDESLERQNWFFCKGQSLMQASYPALYNAIGVAWGKGDNPGTTFNLPDLQGQFIRGVADGSATDPDRDTRHARHDNDGNSGDKVGSYQEDDFKSHLHSENAPKIGGQGAWSFPNAQAWTSSGQTSWGATTDASGGNETRPKNAYVHFIIKAK